MITMRCEYGAHGNNGPQDSPAAYFVEAKCPNCPAPAYPFFICKEDLTTDRRVTCSNCYETTRPKSAWTVLARW